jgi:hypothetical protein
MPVNYPTWHQGVTPNTEPNAVATGWRDVEDVPAIRVRGATYRDSQPLDGVFELVRLRPQKVNRESRYEVYCAWFGVKPRRTFPRIAVKTGGFEIIRNYSGEVIDNIST